MNIKSDLELLETSLKRVEQTKLYDVQKYLCSLKHQTSQLEYFYCDLVKDGRKVEDTFYHLSYRPKEGDLAYFNIGRGFPKELMDGHWCYILKDLGYKMVVIPSTSIKADSKPCHPNFEMDLEIVMDGHKSTSRMQLSDLRSVDIQRLDLRKPFCKVLTARKKIIDFVAHNLLDI